MAKLVFRLLCLVLALDCHAAEAADTPRRPNLILILVDDFGYECVAANGGTSYKTPAMDALAAGGVRFEHCYVQPLCTPTRVQLMTGQYNVRNYTGFGEMDPRSTTFANLLKSADYATCMVGKWQLGQSIDLPKEFGFDEYCLWQHTRRPERYRNPGLEVNGKPIDYTNGEYGPDIVHDHALDFIGRNKEKPFFLYYSMMLTHGPFDPTPDSPDYGKPKQGRKQRQKDDQRHFAEMVAYTDKLVRKLAARLDELGLRDDTLILLVGDNGSPREIRSMLGNREIPGGKGEPTVAGMRVPLIASWPRHMKSGSVCRDLIDSTDFLPTLCEAAGTEVPSSLPIDGRSFLPQLRGEPGNPRQWYYCWYNPRGQLRAEFAANHRYKLHRNGQFFDLEQDPQETRPLTVTELKGDAAQAAKTLEDALNPS